MSDNYEVPALIDPDLDVPLLANPPLSADPPAPVPIDTPDSESELDIPELDTLGSIFDLGAHTGPQAPTDPAVSDYPDLLLEPGDIIKTIELPHLQIAQQYIDLMRSAELGKSGMQLEDIDTLRNPAHAETLVEPSPLLRSVRHFINNSAASL